MSRLQNVTLEDVTIAFRNFAGKEDTYNRAGDRNFSVFLTPQDAEHMASLGWNVKMLKPRDEDDGAGQAYIKVEVSYKTRPPRIGLVTSKNLTYLEEEQLDLLDHVDVETADVTLNPYEWIVNGKSGVKAYLTTLFIKIKEDYLQNKWQAYVDDQREQQRALPGPEDYIDVEYHETRELEQS